ncbi:YchJ family metal-binding protein [Reinekea marina]|nr:YchJ family metal-binding protein [Reinekea marina]MDN3648792.1 YchJ family metal-binding protein [Reinekea marina]
MSTNHCPCGSGELYSMCCDRYHHQGMLPKTVEALMRSRYSAYVVGNADYVMKTWLKEHRPELSRNELLTTKWIRLEVISAKQGLKIGFVEFKAYFEDGDKERCLHEHSSFRKIKNRWFYDQAVDEA